ncbi:MAG: SWIM zinc finger domain-containing protein [Pseudomonadota bacterium]|nr:SWIM zinc finger domain-containing protein [Pseudomonadota bacterium]
MVEVQSYQAHMRRRVDATAIEALRFFRALPKASTSRTPLWVVRGGSGLQATTRQVDGAVRVTDAKRLGTLMALLPKAKTLSVFADDAQQASAWVLDFGDARLTLALSAETWRGFSGEGQALWALMQAGSSDVVRDLPRVRALLNWQSALDPAELSRDLAIKPSVVADALRILGASGMVGFDVAGNHYFHRVLPFDLSMMDDLHPRLNDARALLDSRAVSVIASTPFEALVASGDIQHRVREVEDTLHCTCPWFAKHKGSRGPCKHVLAAAVLQPIQP